MNKARKTQLSNEGFVLGLNNGNLKELDKRIDAMRKDSNSSELAEELKVFVDGFIRGFQVLLEEYNNDLTFSKGLYGGILDSAVPYEDTIVIDNPYYINGYKIGRGYLTNETKSLEKEREYK